MRAILVSVDFSDVLAVTLPYNRHHFDDVCVVTSNGDRASWDVALENRAKPFCTDAFWRGGAHFNKWLALEQGLDWFGRRGRLCIMDVDILWPKVIPAWGPKAGCLYTPLRRMAPLLPAAPPESEWSKFPPHPQQWEWAGYSQLFSGDDPVLGPPPWHETDWRHAGGADSFFQAKWPKEKKLRPPFEVLHIGPSGVNWCGRATPYLDGTSPPESASRVAQLRRFVRGRTQGPDRFRGEKLS